MKKVFVIYGKNLVDRTKVVVAVTKSTKAAKFIVSRLQELYSEYYVSFVELPFFDNMDSAIDYFNL